MPGKELKVLRRPDQWVSSNGIQIFWHWFAIHDAQYSPDGSKIVTASCGKMDSLYRCVEGIAQVWDVASGKVLAVLRGHNGNISSAQFSPDGTQIVTSSWDGTARVWNVATKRELVALRGHNGGEWTAQYSPDGTQIVTAGSDKTARMWDVATGKIVLVLLGHKEQVVSAQFSPDGKHIVTASVDKTARVWDVTTGKELMVLGGHTDWLSSARYSPDGKRIVTASFDKSARVWDAATGQQLMMLRGNEFAVLSAQFSPDGLQIVTAGCDIATIERTCKQGNARLWAATGQQLGVLRGSEKGLSNAQFSPDGKQIVTASEDGAARIYVVHISDLISLAQSRLTRELTCEERVQYLQEDSVCPTPTPVATATP